MYFDAAAPASMSACGRHGRAAGTGLFTTFFFLFPAPLLAAAGRRWRR
jgi:hypothetical protein